MEDITSCQPGSPIPKETLQTDAMLTVQHLSYSIDKKSILKDISFEIKSQGIVAVLGANGSGKSTLLRLLAGFLEPSEGKIFFGQELVLGPDHQLVAGHEGIALVRQDNRLFPLHTVKENLNHVLRDEDDEFKSQRIAQLSQLLGLTPNIDRVLKFLSGGEQQRVAIAAALAANPEILLMDEPFSQTDMYLKQELKKYLSEIVNQLGILLVFVTHEPDDAMSLSDQIFVMDNGKLIEEGDSKGLYYHPKNISTARLTGICNWIPKATLPNKNAFPEFEDNYLVRPNQILVTTEKEENAQEATITRIEFCGFYVNLHLDLVGLDLTLTSSQITNSLEISTGDRVWVKFQDKKA